MNILWISPECPYPPNTGGKIVVWKKMSEMAKENKIYFFCVVDSESELAYEKNIEECCVKACLYRRKSPIGTLIQSIYYPYPAVSRWNRKMIADIDKCCSSVNVDYIIIDFPQMFGVLSESVKLHHKIILNQHNIEHKCMASLAKGIQNPIKRTAYQYVSKQLKIYEDKIYKEENIDLYTFVSSDDKTWFEKTYKNANTYLFPVGADLKFQTNIPHTHKLAYVGKMSYPANVAGVIWFLNNVWDKILLKVPDAEFYIIGKDPAEGIYHAAANKENVIITGTVESVEPYYSDMELIVVPLSAGGGVKVKILEALGYGKLVVTTSKGIEGTDLENKKDIIVQNTPDDFAKACIKILKNPELFEYLRSNAKQKIEEEYSWVHIVKKFQDKLVEISLNRKAR